MVNGHNLSPEEQKEVAEAWDGLLHHYTLAEFYDDLEEHKWSSGYNSSGKLDKIMEYNGPEFENLYLDYRVWVESLVPGSVDGDDIVKPERPADEVYEEEEEDDA